MKMKKYLMLIAAANASGALLLNGCGFELPISSGSTVISAEQENLTDGTIQTFSRWYNTDGEKLAGATISFYDNKELLFEAITDENGNLEACTLPGNTKLKCVVTDSSGTEIADSEVIYKISQDFPAPTIIITHDASDVQEIDIPADNTVLSMAIYITGDKTISHANITRYVEEEAAETDPAQEEPTDPSQEGQTDPAQGEPADPSQEGQTDPAQGEPADPAQTDQTDPSQTDPTQTDQPLQ